MLSLSVSALSVSISLSLYSFSASFHTVSSLWSTSVAFMSSWFSCSNFVTFSSALSLALSVSSRSSNLCILGRYSFNSFLSLSFSPCISSYLLSCRASGLASRSPFTRSSSSVNAVVLLYKSTIVLPSTLS